MQQVKLICDFEGDKHSKEVVERKIAFMFDHGQEDGRNKTTPYFELIKVDVCSDCFNHLTKNRILPYARGAMGNNKYYIRDVKNTNID